MIDIAKLTILGLAIFVLAGGVIGFVKAKSKASLIAGLISSMLLAASFAFACKDPKPGLIAGDLVSLGLVFVFFKRYSASRKFMPSGLMIVLSMISVVVVTMAVMGG